MISWVAAANTPAEDSKVEVPDWEVAESLGFPAQLFTAGYLPRELSSFHRDQIGPGTGVQWRFEDDDFRLLLEGIAGMVERVYAQPFVSFEEDGQGNVEGPVFITPYDPQNESREILVRYNMGRFSSPPLGKHDIPLLERVEILDLAMMNRMTNVDFRAFTGLKVLALPFAGLPDPSALQLPESIEVLIIYNASLTGHFFGMLDNLPSLQRLVLYGCELAPKDYPDAIEAVRRFEFHDVAPVVGPSTRNRLKRLEIYNSTDALAIGAGNGTWSDLQEYYSNRHNLQYFTSIGLFRAGRSPDRYTPEQVANLPLMPSLREFGIYGPPPPLDGEDPNDHRFLKVLGMVFLDQLDSLKIVFHGCEYPQRDRESTQAR